jgi:putative ABC transport system substrate-binding protein
VDVFDALRNGLRDLGYIEGKTIIIEWPQSHGNENELLPIANQLASADVNLVVALGTPAARAALQGTSVPVVFLAGDPVGTGLAASLAHPDGRSTGVSMLNTELAGKRVELLRQLAPGLRRVVFLMNPSNPLDVKILEEARKAAQRRGLKVSTLEARNAIELDAALRAMPRQASTGLLVSPDPFLMENRTMIAYTVRTTNLPAIYPYKENHDAAVLMSYGPSLVKGAYKLAGYIDKILRGAKPSELAIEQMSQYELVIDLRVAREQGIKVPQELLLRADDVIR